jgi:hypothetical protein
LRSIYSAIGGFRAAFRNAETPEFVAADESCKRQHWGFFCEQAIFA